MDINRQKPTETDRHGHEQKFTKIYQNKLKLTEMNRNRQKQRERAETDRN